MTIIRRIAQGPTLIFYTVDTSTALELPLVLSSVAGGFPSPADDYIELQLDLNQFLIRNKAATFFAKVCGDSMRDAGIANGDLLIIDRSIEAEDGRIVVAVVNGEFTVKRLLHRGKEVYLLPCNPKFPEIKLEEGMQCEIWGVVIHVIKSF